VLKVATSDWAMLGAGTRVSDSGTGTSEWTAPEASAPPEGVYRAPARMHFRRASGRDACWARALSVKLVVFKGCSPIVERLLLRKASGVVVARPPCPAGAHDAVGLRGLRRQLRSN
jgi:hypothetical protein